jgi:hypothetical protein
MAAEEGTGWDPSTGAELSPAPRRTNHHHTKHSLSLSDVYTLILTMSDNKGEARRSDALVKERNKMREEFKRQKQQLIDETEKARPSTNRFVGQNTSGEELLKKQTVGLVRLEDFEEVRREIDELKAREAAQTSELKCVQLLLHRSIHLLYKEMAYRV